jgi:hypothetical protein
MLAWLDRRMADLGADERVLVLALRSWAAASRQGACPFEALYAVPGLERSQAMLALDAAFYWIAANARRKMTLGCPCCGRVGDDEALILAAVFAATEAAAGAAVRDLVNDEAAPLALRLARGVGKELR